MLLRDVEGLGASGSPMSLIFRNFSGTLYAGTLYVVSLQIHTWGCLVLTAR